MVTVPGGSRLLAISDVILWSVSLLNSLPPPQHVNEHLLSEGFLYTYCFKDSKNYTPCSKNIFVFCSSA